MFGHIATDWFSATGLVKLLIAELSQSHIEIVGPKDIAAERFYLTQADAQRTGATRATPNGLRTLVAQNAKFRSIATTTEAYIVGRLFNGSLEFLKAESRTTDALIRSVSPRDHERFRSIILVKRIHSDHEVQKLVYPVIGERTIELAHEYGIDEIYVDEFCAIQGKENVIEMCQMWNIKLARL